MDELLTRRTFLAIAPVWCIGWSTTGRVRRVRSRHGIHPDPRPGIDARDVLTAEQLDGWGKDVIALFAKVREIPGIIDGIHCYCGCATKPGFRSLLVCYGPNGMARGCPICQGEGRLAYKHWMRGERLDQIRKAIDAEYA
jgi:hypothetical protein